MEGMIKVTSLDDLKAYSSGAVVELPPFGPGQPFFARLRRPSMMTLITSGKIPNELLTRATQMFNGESKDADEGSVKEMMDVINVLAEAMFVEPTVKEMKQAGVELTDEQYLFLFNYSQNGVKVLEPFLHE